MNGGRLLVGDRRFASAKVRDRNARPPLFPDQQLARYHGLMTTYDELIGRIAARRATVMQPAASHLDQLLGIARDVTAGRRDAHENAVTMTLLGQLAQFANVTKPSVTKAVGLLAVALTHDLNGSPTEAAYERDECDRVLIGAGIY